MTDRARWWLVSVALLGWSTGGCSPAVGSSKLEDRARREVPVPICLKALERRGTAGVSSADPTDYWSLVLPSYDTSSGTVDRSAPDCAGHEVFANPLFQDAEGPRTGLIPVKTEDLAISPGANDFKVLWLRLAHFGNGDAGGPLALARPREGTAELYSIGTYRGSAAASHFSIERLGPRILVTAGDNACSSAKPGQACQTKLAVFLMSAGQLLPVADLTLDRIEYGTAPGVSGTVQYRMTATPFFEPKSLRVAEQIVVRDSTQTTIRKSNLDRRFELKGSALTASTGSLWDEVVVTPNAPPAPPPPPPPKPARDR
ncbi:MAG TPA: hypothetical protein VJV79_37715 [Polyangiaceae bacterium]|nr:hypothetical protein [Polyangiaceae bacterium]